MNTINIIDKLYKENIATREELLYLLDNIDKDSINYLTEKANEVRMIS